MLPLDDPRWQGYTGGHGVSYDASPRLWQLIEDGAVQSLWDELWNELHHQGNVDSASYAAVPWLVEFVRRSQRIDWNPLALVAAIELERPGNPEVPPELAESYFASIRALPAILGTHSDQQWDDLVLRAVVTCIALARGNRWFAKVYFELSRKSAARWFYEEFGEEIGDG